MKFVSSMTSFFKINNKTSYLLLVVLLIGIILRVYGLTEQNYWYDEVITLEVVQDSLGSIILGPRPPLYLVFAHFWIGNFGTSEEVTRLLSIIFGVSSIVLIFFIGRSLFNRKIGLLSSFFMSVSQFQIYYSQELRYYSLYQLLTLFSFFFYIRLLNSKSYIHTVLYILSTILLYYSHDFAVLVIAVQNLYVLIKYKTLRPVIPRWFITQFVVLLGIAPRFVQIFSNKAIGEGGPNWIQSPDMLSPLKTILAYMGLRLAVPNSIAVVIAIIFLLAGIVTYLMVFRKVKLIKPLNQSIAALRRNLNLRSETLLVLLWLFVPIALILLMSEVLKPMYVNRYLICSAPACYILVALLLTKLNKVIPIAVILITYAILISPGLYIYYTKPFRQDWREIGSYIKAHDIERDSVVLISSFNLRSFSWYNKGNYKYCDFPAKRLDLSMLFKICKLDDTDYFWVILRKREMSKSWKSFYNDKDSLFRIVKERKFVVSFNSPAVTLYSFEKVKE